MYIFYLKKKKEKKNFNETLQKYQYDFISRKKFLHYIYVAYLYLKLSKN